MKANAILCIYFWLIRYGDISEECDEYFDSNCGVTKNFPEISESDIMGCHV